MEKSDPQKKSDIEVPASDNSPKHRSNLVINFFIQFAVVAVLFFAIGFVAGQKKIDIDKKHFIPKITVSNQLPPPGQNLDFSLFWDVFNALPEKYLEKGDIDGQKLLYGAISGMVRSLGDPYTAFLDPSQNEAIKGELSGSYEGVGIQIGFNDKKRLAVIAPLKGTPAVKAGVRAKDLILKIENKETFDLTLPEAVDLIRGPAGSKVKLALQHENEDKPYEVEIERAKIAVKSVEVEYRQSLSSNRQSLSTNKQSFSANRQSLSSNRQANDNEVAIVKVSRFGEQTDSEWDSAVKEIASRNVKGVIVDMRNNPGGLLTSSIHLSSEFIKGTVVKQQFSDGRVQPLATDHEGKLLKTPLVVLVNGGSASAAEIFAGAMQDNNRGKLVGEKTFGKGSVQDAVDFPGGSGLHVTIAKWLTPKGNSIHQVGIEPDVKIELTADDTKQEKDPQVDKALEMF